MVDCLLEDLAIIHAEFLLIHPFREGNGRLARWLAELMCLQSGLPLPDFGFDIPGNSAGSGAGPPGAIGDIHKKIPDAVFWLNRGGSGFVICDESDHFRRATR